MSILNPAMKETSGASVVLGGF